MKYDLTANGRLTSALLPERDKPVKKPRGELSPSSPVYLAGGILFSALFLIGLFAGFFLESPLGILIAGGEPIFHGSLFGVIVEVARGSIPFPEIGKGLSGILPLLLYVMSIVLALSALTALALTALSLFCPRQARRICFFNGGLTVSVYGSLLLLGLVESGLTSAPVFDLPAALVLISAAALLWLFATARRGVAGSFRGLYLFCSLTATGAFCVAPLPALLDSLLSGSAATAEILSGALFLLSALNLLLTLLLLGSKGGTLTELIRFSLQLLLSLALCAVLLRETGIAALFLLLPSALELVLAVLSRTLLAGEKKGPDNSTAESKDQP